MAPPPRLNKMDTRFELRVRWTSMSAFLVGSLTVLGHNLCQKVREDLVNAAGGPLHDGARSCVGSVDGFFL